MDRFESPSNLLHIACSEGGRNKHRIGSVVVKCQLRACWNGCRIVGVFVVGVCSTSYSDMTQSVKIP
jgi:hypothetical protein